MRVNCQRIASVVNWCPWYIYQTQHLKLHPEDPKKIMGHVIALMYAGMHFTFISENIYKCSGQHCRERDKTHQIQTQFKFLLLCRVTGTFTVWCVNPLTFECLSFQNRVGVWVLCDILWQNAQKPFHPSTHLQIFLEIKVEWMPVYISAIICPMIFFGSSGCNLRCWVWYMYHGHQFTTLAILWQLTLMIGSLSRFYRTFRVAI